MLVAPPPPGTVTPSQALTENIPAHEAFKGFPHSLTVKGMFLARMVSELGPAWDAVERDLVAPPRWGKYLPFSDYPMIDQGILAFAAAARRHPRVPLGEAVRRLARDDIQVFLQSTVGRITASVVDGARAALLAVPLGYKHTVKGCWYEAEALGDRSVRLVLHDLAGAWGYQIGQLEGIVMNWGGTPSTRCTQLDARRREFAISW